MKRQEDIIIELSEKATDFAINNQDFGDVDFEHLPFNNFTFYYPMACVSGGIDYNKLISIAKYSGLQGVDPIVLNLLKADLMKKKSYVNVNITETVLFASVQDDDREPLFEFKITSDSLQPEITYTYLQKNKKNLPDIFSDEKLEESALLILRMIINVLSYLVKPKELIVKQDRPLDDELKKTNKKLPYRVGRKVNYLSKKVYVVDDLEKYAKKSSKTRKYTRRVESWNVCGHWRHYKSGKKVWINQSVRGKRDKEVKPQTYKITKMEEDK